MPQAQASPGCSYLASLLGEEMIATATEASAWVLVEHAGPWGAQPLTDSGLPPATVAELARRTAATGVRVQLVSPPEGVPPAASYLAGDPHTAGGAWLRRLPTAAIDDILDLDFAEIAAGLPAAGTPVDRPLYLVCANDRNDPCCGRTGPPILAALTAQFGDRARRTPHVGGHKYAGIVVAFPHVYFYGRLEPGSAVAVVAAHEDGHIILDKYRGRSSYGHGEQAAEYFLRRELGLTGVRDIRRVAPERSIGPDSSETVFAASDETYAVRVIHGEQRPARLQSCADHSPTVPPSWQLGGIVRGTGRPSAPAARQPASSAEPANR
jgi:Sucrase/ferredoxin-like